MERPPHLVAARRRRLVEELAESGFALDVDDPVHRLVLEELDYALRPPVFERRVPTVGAIVEPRHPPDTWADGTRLTINEQAIGEVPLGAARRFADGLSSWLVRRVDGRDSGVVFDRAAGSERDLVVLADVLGATVVQRHPSGSVRVVGAHGVLRWEGHHWHHEPPLAAWVDSIAACAEHGDRAVLDTLLQFAVHDLGSRGIGAILVYRPTDDPGPPVEHRLPTPPALDVRRPSALAPLRHALDQVDGATVVDRDGVLRAIGVRLVPSLESERDVAGYRGMRHTAGRRYSFDDPLATVIVVSEDGPVTVLRGGALLGVSPDPED